MGDLDTALDGLAAADLHGLPAPALLERTAELVRARNRIDAELARTARRADLAQAPEQDGLKSMASWLRGHCRLSARTSFAVVRAGRTAEQLPVAAAGFAAGLITADQIAVLAPVVHPQNLAKAADLGIEVPEVDKVLADVATTGPHDQLRQVVAHYLARLDPDGPEPDPTEGRSLTITTHDNGWGTGRFEADPVGLEKIKTVLESFVQKNRPAGDDRTRAQQLGDALVQWADVTLAAGHAPVLRTVKPQVFVTIGIEDLIDPATGPAAGTMGFGAQISAARTRWLGCDGEISRIIMGPDGRVLDFGRRHRFTPPSLRKAVELSDGGCIFAGCGAPPFWCDVHHVLEWHADHGETSLENSALLCERHHTKAHHGFRIERDPDGRWHTYRPDGTEILIPTPLRS